MANVKGARFRLAVCAYTARFELVLDMIERDGFILRRNYSERKTIKSGIRMSWLVLRSVMQTRPAHSRVQRPDLGADR